MLVVVAWMDLAARHLRQSFLLPWVGSDSALDARVEHIKDDEFPE
jgi:hypothetical protein